MEPLTHPIRGLFDHELRIIEADAELRRLHLRGGGRNDEPLAVGALANAARQCLKFGTRMARQVRISDGDQALALWTEWEPSSDGLRLTITCLRAFPAADIAPMQTNSAAIAQTWDGAIPSVLLQLDSALVIRGHSTVNAEIVEDCPLGQVLTNAFIIEDEEIEATAPILSAVAERTAFAEKLVIARQSRRAYRLSGQPLWDAARIFAGYACTLRPTESAPSIIPGGGSGLMPISGNFGRDLAPILRQPVGRIIANAETIATKMHGALREGYADYAGDIANAARHLQSLIDDMSDLEAVESATFRPAADPIDLADVARRVAGLLSVKASDHHIRLVAPDEAASAPAVGEFRRVLQIVLNLVSNAIRYSPDGSTVTIDVGCEGQNANLRVIDEGAGIAEKDQERIFSKFERLGRHDDGGSGLGLYISRRIATALNGTLKVESSGPNGSQFLLTLPARD